MHLLTSCRPLQIGSTWQGNFAGFRPSTSRVTLDLEHKHGQGESGRGDACAVGIKLRSSSRKQLRLRRRSPVLYAHFTDLTGLWMLIRAGRSIHTIS